jgi:hypothetical protein
MPGDALQLEGTGRRRLRRPVLTGTVCGVVLLLPCVGCGNSERRATLADGSPGAPPPAVLRKLGASAILTTVRAVPMHSVDARDRACVGLTTGHARTPNETLVERVDHLEASVTFRPRNGPFVFGCTAAARSLGVLGRWCGHVVGEIRARHLVDPRLDIACRTPERQAIGSAWIEPVAGARWIVVRDHALVQIYPTAASLPVRVTTQVVDIPTATAVFRIEQYDAEGTRVSEATIRTAVAG